VADGNIANLEAVSEAIRRAWRRLGTSTKFVALALPASAVITKRIILPAGLRDQELEVQVESEANQYIPFALDEVNLDFQVIGPAASGADEDEVLIAASRKEKVEDRVAAAEAAGLKALVMDVESYAALSAFELVQAQLPDQGEDKIIALVDAGANVMNVSVLRNGVQVYAREQAFGGFLLTQDIMRHFGMSLEEAEGAKRNSSLPENYESDLLRPSWTRWRSKCPGAAVLLHLHPVQPGRPHRARRGLRGHPGSGRDGRGADPGGYPDRQPFANMSLSSKIRPKNLTADAPALLVACGLALRRFDS
jgi:type IV pilus assembly protein PilM